MLFPGLLLAAALAAGPVGPAWQARFPDRILGYSVARDGRCVAGLTRTHAIVLDSAGERLWAADLPTSIAEPLPEDAFVLAPSCDWIVLSPGHHSAVIQIVHKDGTGVAVALAAGDDLLPEDHQIVRSVAVSPDGRMIAVGSERGRLWLISNTGRILKTLIVNNHGHQVGVAFSATGQDVIVTGWYVVGVLDLEANWRWRREVDFATLSYSDDLRAFAGLSVPAHGPPGGSVALLDERGRSMWQRTLWDPSAAISPDGASLVVAGAPMTTGAQEADSNQAWRVARSGSTVARRATRGRVDFVSGALRCVIMRERNPSGDGIDVFGLDDALEERWRVSAGTEARWPELAGRLLVTSAGDRLIAYQLPRCG